MRAVATGEDVNGFLIGRKIYDMPILADGVVRFIGEKVAAVAADSQAIAEQAVEFIEVEYEEMEPLLDPLQAIEPKQHCFIQTSAAIAACFIRSKRRATSLSI